MCYVQSSSNTWEHKPGKRSKGQSVVLKSWKSHVAWLKRVMFALGMLSKLSKLSGTNMKTSSASSWNTDFYLPGCGYHGNALSRQTTDGTWTQPECWRHWYKNIDHLKEEKGERHSPDTLCGFWTKPDNNRGDEKRAHDFGAVRAWPRLFLSTQTSNTWKEPGACFHCNPNGCTSSAGSVLRRGSGRVTEEEVLECESVCLGAHAPDI